MTVPRTAESEASGRAEHISIWGELAGVPLRQHYIQANGVMTRVLEAGNGAPLVLVHGTGGHAEAYARNFAGLSAHYRVIAYDMAGHGYSDKPNRPYTVDYLSDHLIGVLDALDIPAAHLSGESLGGWVTAWTAAFHPERVLRLVLNTPGNITNKPEVMRKVKESTLLAAQQPTYSNVRSRVEFLFNDPSDATDELVLMRQRIYSAPGFAETMQNVVALQEWEIREPYAWSSAWCQKISAPTLLLWSDNDPTGGLDEAELLETWIPDSRIYVVSNAGHWPQWEHPDEFNRVHLDFINGKAYQR